MKWLKVASGICVLIAIFSYNMEIRRLKREIAELKAALLHRT